MISYIIKHHHIKNIYFMTVHDTYRTKVWWEKSLACINAVNILAICLVKKDWRIGSHKEII